MTRRNNDRIAKNKNKWIDIHSLCDTSLYVKHVGIVSLI